MRRIFIWAVIALFFAYNIAAYYLKDSVAVPDYREVEVNFVGNRSLTVWKADEAFRSRQLMNLGAKHYQPLPGGLTLSDGTRFDENHVLTEKDLTLVANDLLDKGMKIQLRDPGAIRYLAGRGYAVRNPIFVDGAAIYQGGEPLTKEVIDDLRERGMTRIGVQGHGGPVSAQVGTMAMVILMFVALVMALKGVLFEPLTAIIAEREKDVEVGLDLAKANERDLGRIAEDRRQKLHTLQRAHLAKIEDGRREALREADQVLHDARLEERRLKKELFDALHGEIDRARAAVAADTANFARSIADRVMGRDS